MTKVKIPAKHEISMIRADESYAIRKSDWDRLKRMINQINKPFNFISIICSLLSGAAISLFFTLFTLPPDFSSSIKSFFIIFISGAIIISTILFIIEKKLLNKMAFDKETILKEMDEIIKLY